jgi:hypothetical protein
MESSDQPMKLTQQLSDALATARAFAAELIDTDYPASVCLSVHARVIAGILTDLETL